MPRNRRRVALGLAAFAAGCGGRAALPTDPTPARTTLTLDFGSIEVIEDCDGIEGDGDFDFGVAVHSTAFPIDAVYSEQTSLGPGGKSRVLGRRSYTVPAAEGTVISVELSATELDRSVFGEEYNDERLDHAEAEVDHVFQEGAWSHRGPQSITLGTAGCRVRLYWSADGT